VPEVGLGQVTWEVCATNLRQLHHKMLSSSRAMFRVIVLHESMLALETGFAEKATEFAV